MNMNTCRDMEIATTEFNALFIFKRCRFCLIHCQEGMLVAFPEPDPSLKFKLRQNHQRRDRNLPPDTNLHLNTCVLTR